MTARRAIFGDDAIEPMRFSVAELVEAQLGTSVAEWLFTVERRSVTSALALADTVTTACEPLRPLRQLHVGGVPGLPAGALWPPPPDPRLVLGDSPEAAWIDGVGARARRLRTRPASAPLVIGHGDWHVEHLRLDGDRAAAVYDWDSAGSPRALPRRLRGRRRFTADWSVDEPPVVPNREVAIRFVADYEEARGRRFSPPNGRPRMRTGWR